jgi:Flp pilus assembly protein TadG
MSGPEPVVSEDAVPTETAKPPRRFRRWWLPEIGRDDRASTAVEFAIIAAPFLALMGAIIESALAFLAGQVLDTATNDAARLIRTGQAKQQGLDLTSFTAEVCKRLYVLVNCSGISVDARVLSGGFSSFSTSQPTLYDSNGNFDPSKLTFDMGGSTDIVVVRVYYQYPILINKLAPGLATLPNGKRLLTGVAAFRNEPFPW